MDADVSCVGLASVPQYGGMIRSFHCGMKVLKVFVKLHHFLASNEYIKQMRTQYSYTTALLPTMRMPCVTSTGGARMDADASCLGLTSVSPYNMRQMRPLPRLTFNAPLQSADTSSNPSLSPRNIDRGIGCDTNSHAMWNGNAHGTRISDSLMQMSNHTPSAHFATPSMQPMFHGHQGPRMHPMPMSFSKQNQSQSIAVKTEAASKNELYDDVPAIGRFSLGFDMM
eukprot:645748_1